MYKVLKIFLFCNARHLINIKNERLVIVKKILKITCAITLMLCIIASSMVFAGATDTTSYTTVYEPKFLNDSGVEIVINPWDSAIPTSVVAGNRGVVSLTRDPSDFALSTGFKFVPDGTSNQTDMKLSSMTYAEVSGFMIRVKTDYNGVFALQLISGGSAISQWGYVKWYTLDSDDTEWTQSAVENYGVTLETGFDGYVYIPFDTFTGHTWIDTDIVNGIKLMNNKTTLTEVVFSAPIFVDKATLQENSLPSADKVVMNGEEMGFFTREDYTAVYEPKILNEAGDTEYTVNPTDEAFPLWVAGENSPLTPTNDPTPFGLSVGMKYTRPSSDINTKMNFSPMPYKNVAGYIIKIESNTDTDFKVPFCVLYHNGEDVEWKYVYEGCNWYVLDINSKEWKQSKVFKYGVTLDAGFEGYLYIPFDTLTLDGIEWQDDYNICGIVAKQGEGFTEATLSMPMFVDKTTLQSNGLPSADKLVMNNREYDYFDYSTVYKPEFINTSGSKIDLYTTDSSIPYSVAGSDKRITLTKDPSDFNLSTGFKFTPSQTISGNIDIKVSAMYYADVSGFIIKVKSNSTSDLRFALQLLYRGTSATHQYEAVNWYTLDSDDTEWKSAKVYDYGPLLEAGFDGYLYIPFDTFKNNGSTPTVNEEDAINGIKLVASRILSEVSFSAPIFVNKASLKDGLPSADKMVMNGKIVDLFSRYEGKTVVYESKFLDNAGTGEYTVNPDDEAFPSWIQKTGSDFTPAEDISNFDLNVGMKYTYPAVSARSEIHTSSMAYADAAGYIIRIKCDSEKDFRLSFRILQGTAATYQYDGVNWYILDSDDNEWQSTVVSGYGPTFKAGFDGYLYIPFNTIKMNGATTVFSDTSFINGIAIWGGADYETVNLSVPMFVKRNSLAENGLPTADTIKLNGERRVAYFSNVGDADADGEIAAGDLVALRKALIAPSELLSKKRFDANADGVADILDLVRLKKYIAGENVTLG